MFTIWTCLRSRHIHRVDALLWRAVVASKVPYVALIIVSVEGHMGALSLLALLPTGNVVLSGYCHLYVSRIPPIVVQELPKTAWKQFQSGESSWVENCGNSKSYPAHFLNLPRVVELVTVDQTLAPVCRNLIPGIHVNLPFMSCRSITWISNRCIELTQRRLV